MGLETLKPSMGVAKRMFFFAAESHSSGIRCPSAMPEPFGPRKDGQGAAGLASAGQIGRRRGGQFSVHPEDLPVLHRPERDRLASSRERSELHHPPAASEGECVGASGESELPLSRGLERRHGFLPAGSPDRLLAARPRRLPLSLRGDTFPRAGRGRSLPGHRPQSPAREAASTREGQ